MSVAQCSLLNWTLQCTEDRPDLSTTAQRVRAALDVDSYTRGTTHSFYLYPARFHPEFARAIIELYSSPNDVVLDPFMGGGTTIVEALALGRRAIGVDVNALGAFVAQTRTSPLSLGDELELHSWAKACTRLSRIRTESIESIALPRNFPVSVAWLFERALEIARKQLSFPRQLRFARCALLRLGQVCFDGRYELPTADAVLGRLPELVDQLLRGLREFVTECQEAGVLKHQIRKRRLLLARGAEG